MSADRQLVLPKLGLTMTEGSVAEWSIQPGTRFTAGQVVFVVESDKAAVEFEAPADGVLHEILVPVGQTVAVGTEIGKWTLAGASAAASRPDEAQPPAAPPTVTPAATPATTPAATPAAATPPTRIIATPLARRHASSGNVDLVGMTGTGPHGRIVAADVAAAVLARSETTATAATSPAAKAPGVAAAATSTAAATAAGVLVAPTTSQRTMAARVSASKREIPHFYLSIDVDMGELFALRQSLNELPDRPRASVTHLLIAAVAQALRMSPDMNAVWTEEGLQQLPTLDVGLAVDTPHGLMSPVVRDLGQQSFFGIVRRADEVIGRARTASLRAADVQGGAITISNAGMHDVRYMSSIIVPGQSAILGVGSVQSCFRPDAEGRPVLRRELGLVLSADHRIHTGVSALTFLNQLKSILQRPLQLLAGA
ncbi:dihydrolipoamide acetyltransferase family protein [Caenimonas sp. SL110]|uniref:dihydrolipoamide acetyltransferase family protein n=1 Tax=Caenimonas sp. SL110 TaxID=1450524 RepID=UPI0006542659|nr:dihydrolipoamide acetyltransferase family protein [Caenimonas sp. SL110]